MLHRITSWLKRKQIDFMSLNRLRLNQTVSSTIPVRLSYTEKTRMVENLLWARCRDTSITFENMELVRNPYGITPLTMLAIFHTGVPCRLSYVVENDSAKPWEWSDEDVHNSHVVPILGLCPETENRITLSLHDEDGRKLAKREFSVTTEALPDDYAYPKWQDDEGNVRYFLNIPSRNGKVIRLSQNHFLLMSDKLCTRTEQKPLPTHLFEVDLLGRCYRTYYVGRGMYAAYGEVSETDPSLVVLGASDTKDAVLLKIDRETGEICPASLFSRLRPSPKAVALSREHLRAIESYSSERFALDSELLEKIPYAVTGWLVPPVFYRAASVETTSAVELSELQEKYGISFTITGDTLFVDTVGDPVQEIVFSRQERLYQLDLSQPTSVHPAYANYRYTFAVPFTEMYSGTYSIVIRFRDGRQEVLKDTLTLSRARA